MATKIVPGGIYKRIDNDRTYWACMTSVMQHKNEVMGTLEVCGFPPSRMREGGDAMNTWTLVHDPLGGFAEDLGLVRVEPAPLPEYPVEEVLSSFKPVKFKNKNSKDPIETV